MYPWVNAASHCCQQDETEVVEGREEFEEQREGIEEGTESIEEGGGGGDCAVFK